MSRNVKISAALIGVFLAVVAVIAVAAGGDGDEQSVSPHRRDTPDGHRAGRRRADERTSGRR
ncbi:hypothetical protein LRS13_20565 [Svornostia abyssi]|uniref:Uncharacterized protein n=1 Tax=Svornostia abyssi TaxID=2898438 RepID=A0ABY5PEF6_9ACTN|nr:hypothetical protein LRS13_20565 [Parviterribacteraceae bacterium J379]